MKLLVINNLASGLGDGSVFDFVRAVVKDGDEVVIRSTNGKTDMRAFLHDADDFDVVVAAGGDGTIATVSYMLAETGIPVLPFPAGTANLLAANVASPSDPHALAKMLHIGNVMDFDIGEIELADGQKFGFLLIAGAGYDAAIMKGAEQTKKLFGPVAYFTSAFANATPQFSDFTLVIDGKEIKSSGVGVLIVNFSKIQFDISVVHENLPRDGAFDVMVLNTKDAFGLIPVLFAAFLDRGGDFPERTDAIELYRGSEIEVHADPPMLMQYDGEVTNLKTPFKVKVLSKAARFIVSDECMAVYG